MCWLFLCVMLLWGHEHNTQAGPTRPTYAGAHPPLLCASGGEGTRAASSKAAATARITSMSRRGAEEGANTSAARARFCA